MKKQERSFLLCNLHNLLSEDAPDRCRYDKEDEAE